MDKNQNNIENQMEKCSIGFTINGINELNDDCLRIIFSYLPIADRIKIERVSKRWQSVSKDSWHDLKDFSLAPDLWGLPGPWVGYRRSKCVTDKILEAVLTRCGRFIKTITMISSNIGYQVLNKLNQDTLEIFSRLCTNLESLKTTLLLDSQGLHIIKPLCKNLKQFYFLAQSMHSPTSFEDDFLNLFKLMKKLNCLWLAKCQFTGECLSYLPVDTVQEICLQRCILKSVSSLCNAIQRLEMLQTLILDECSDINDSLLKVLTSKAQTLKALALCNLGPGISEKGLQYISKLVCLEKLQLNAPTKVTNKVINVIATNCRQLSFLDVCCSSITDEGIFHVSSLPKLRHLKISNLKVTGQYLKRIRTLEYLDCKHCILLENDNVCALIERSPHLQILDLEGCEKINFEVVKTALNFNTQRKTLTISTHRTSIISSDGRHDYPSANVCTTNFLIEFFYGGFTSYSKFSDTYYNYFTEDYKPVNYMNNYMGFALIKSRPDFEETKYDDSEEEIYNFSDYESEYFLDEILFE